VPALVLVFLILIQGPIQGTPLEQLIQTERDFSRTSEQKGMRDAFLAYLADDGILFRPGPVPGKKWWSGQPPTAGLLTWRPVYADISREGDLGYTTGPYEFKSSQGNRTGSYFTIWKKQADGTFKFVIDFGIVNAPPASPPAEEFPSAPPAPDRRVDPAEVEKAREEILKLDREFSEASVTSGFIAALEARAGESLRVFRRDRLPAVGKTSMRTLLAGKPGTLSWSPEKSDVAASADLGYTYGKTSFKLESQQDLQSGYYVRVWKRLSRGQWQVVLDILN
jgi:ketosteroid isomerase-like protein